MLSTSMSRVNPQRPPGKYRVLMELQHCPSALFRTCSRPTHQLSKVKPELLASFGGRSYERRDVIDNLGYHATERRTFERRGLRIKSPMPRRIIGEMICYLALGIPRLAPQQFIRHHSH